jgi:hypothetical protein
MSHVRRRVFRDVEAGREKIVIHQVQDVAEVKKINEMTRLANGSGTSSFWQKRQWVKVATIPLVLLDQWAKQALRTAPGRI